mmetsp:Transcript_9720/g.18308  ORF Transcript_9720/g.18308 Transcript_9720/m.18308 type:complete len:284 (+) Transcript_9720:1678-2529(+)
MRTVKVRLAVRKRVHPESNLLLFLGQPLLGWRGGGQTGHGNVQGGVHTLLQAAERALRHDALGDAAVGGALLPNLCRLQYAGRATRRQVEHAQVVGEQHLQVGARVVGGAAHVPPQPLDHRAGALRVRECECARCVLLGDGQPEGRLVGPAFPAVLPPQRRVQLKYVAAQRLHHLLGVQKHLLEVRALPGGPQRGVAVPPSQALRPQGHGGFDVSSEVGMRLLDLAPLLRQDLAGSGVERAQHCFLHRDSKCRGGHLEAAQVAVRSQHVLVHRKHGRVVQIQG